MSMSNTKSGVTDRRRKTRRKVSIEETLCMVLDDLRGECSVAELYLRHQWPKKV